MVGPIFFRVQGLVLGQGSLVGRGTKLGSEGRLGLPLAHFTFLVASHNPVTSSFRRTVLLSGAAAALRRVAVCWETPCPHTGRTLTLDSLWGDFTAHDFVPQLFCLLWLLCGNTNSGKLQVKQSWQICLRQGLRVLTRLMCLINLQDYMWCFLDFTAEHFLPFPWW